MRLIVFTLLACGCAQVDLPGAIHREDAGADLSGGMCSTNNDCTQSMNGPLCDTTSGLCVACLTTNDLCPTGRYCSSAAHECALGCKNNSDCGVLDGATQVVCDTTAHQCVGCVTSSDCPTGTSCCLSACIDTTTDPANCGGCGATCDTTHSLGTACKAGSCTYTGCATNYADCTMAAPDSDGCETLANTTANCGACGACKTGGIVTSSMCTVTSSTASCAYQCSCNSGATATASTCNGTSCSYTCAAGRADCNAMTGGDTDGCECPTATSAAQGAPGCCTSGACQTAHNNGESGAYFDCAALDTLNATEATNAANSATGIAGTVSGGWECMSDGNTATEICKQSASACTCWTYSVVGTLWAPGHLKTNTADSSCHCAVSTDPSWN